MGQLGLNATVRSDFRYNWVMSRVRRLAILMIIGAFVGWGILTEVFLRRFHGYDHGHGETARCMLAAAIVGAFCGLATELALRSLKSPPRHFSIRDLAMLTTLVALILGISAIAIRFAQSWN